MDSKEISRKCCIVGGGPAGMMLGFLLARAGVEVVVLEKHSDFLRDFRGDTVHPSTLELMHELGILEEFLSLPHEKVTNLGFQIGEEYVQLVDFSYLRTHCKFIALMPQWDFLNFLSSNAARYETFSLMMDTEATGLVEEDGRVVGVKASTSEGEIEIRADLVVAADGRGSILREAAELDLKEVGAPMDVLWFRLPKTKSDPEQTLGRLDAGVFLIMLNRGDYWQCGLIIPKGAFEEYKKKGLDNFRALITQVAPFTSDRVDGIETWDPVKLLTVKVDRLRKWHKPGLLCIGDAAHAMSPVGGVGINLAVQDAVAAANLLWQPLSEGTCSEEHFQYFQKRRMYPARMTQRLQVAIQKNVVSRILKSKERMTIPWFVRGFNKFPRLRALPANLIGVGFRAEHIETPERTVVVKVGAAQD